MNEAMKSLAGIKTYSISELFALTGEDRHAVRDEAMRRHALAARRLATAQREITALENLLKEAVK